MSQMSPSNREVIVQDNTNVDGSLQYKDERERERENPLIWLDFCFISVVDGSKTLH